VKSLKDLGLNGTGEIAHVAGGGPIAQRLLAMGFLHGTRLREADALQIAPTNGNGNGKGHP